MPVAGRRIVVTGAGGFVGGYVLAAFDEDVSAGSVELIPLTATGEDGRALDITDHAAVEDMIEALQPFALIHLAAIAAPADARRDPGHAWRVNVDGTLNIAQAILSRSPRTRLVFAGSSEAYGSAFNHCGGIVDEAAALAPMTPYAASKAAADIALGQMAHDGLSVVRFRPFNHTGPGQPPAFVVPAFAGQVAAILRGDREPLVEVGNLDAIRDFLDVRDVARAYRLACDPERDLSSGEAVNLASGQGRSVRSILDILLHRAGREIDVRTDPARLRPAEVPVAVGRAERAADLFGWRPEIDFEQTIVDVLEAQLNH